MRNSQVPIANIARPKSKLHLCRSVSLSSFPDAYRNAREVDALARKACINRCSITYNLRCGKSEAPRCFSRSIATNDDIHASRFELNVGPLEGTKARYRESAEVHTLPFLRQWDERTMRDWM